MIQLPRPESLKPIGGGDHEVWNDRIVNLVLAAIPMGDKENLGAVGTAVASGMLDIKAADPVEGMLVSHLLVAHEAALAMYRKAWVQDNFEIKAKYLALADKTQRTVVMLTERLDHHRGRGQQQITVKHVTVNADQAIVGNVTAGGGLPLKSKELPHAIEHQSQLPMRSQDQGGEAVSVAGNPLVSTQACILVVNPPLDRPISLVSRPPAQPPCWWTRTMEVSIIWTEPSWASARASKIKSRCQPFASEQTGYSKSCKVQSPSADRAMVRLTAISRRWR